MPPTPADVIEHLNQLIRATEQTDEELWSAFVKALRTTNAEVYRLKYPMFGVDHRKNIADIWNSLPEKVQLYIGSEGEMMRMSQSYTEEELKFEKTRFFKTMPNLQKRSEYIELHLRLDGGKSSGLLLD